MTLYEKLPNGRYKEYVPPAPTISSELEPEQVVTMIGTMGICLMESISRLLPDHSKLARETRKVNTAILDLFRNTGKPLDTETAEYAVDCWNETMQRIARGAR
jgi:hypothetical protein